MVCNLGDSKSILQRMFYEIGGFQSHRGWGVLKLHLMNSPLGIFLILWRYMSDSPNHMTYFDGLLQHCSNHLKNGGNFHLSHELTIHCDWCNPSICLDQPITKGRCQPPGGHVTLTTDTPTSTRRGLWSSLLVCKEQHCLFRSHSLKCIMQSWKHHAISRLSLVSDATKKCTACHLVDNCWNCNYGTLSSLSNHCKSFNSSLPSGIYMDCELCQHWFR